MDIDVNGGFRRPKLTSSVISDVKPIIYSFFFLHDSVQTGLQWNDFTDLSQHQRILICGLRWWWCNTLLQSHWYFNSYSSYQKLTVFMVSEQVSYHCITKICLGGAFIFNTVDFDMNLNIAMEYMPKDTVYIVFHSIGGHAQNSYWRRDSHEIGNFEHIIIFLAVIRGLDIAAEVRFLIPSQSTVLEWKRI